LKVSELLTQWTALPNLHPALVHFPIAMFPLALLLDAASLAVRRAPWLDRAAASIWVVGAVSAVVAYLAGRSAADGLVDIPPTVQPLIGHHADWATLTVVAGVGVAVGRLAVTLRDRRAERLTALPLRGALLAIALAMPWLVFQTADRGGALVYQHAVAVSVPAPLAPPLPEPSAPADPTNDRLVTEAADPARVRALPKLPPQGLALSMDGRALLTLEGVQEDVQVDVRMEVGSFEGALGAIHHVRSAVEGGFFSVHTDGRATLGTWTPQGQRTLDSTTVRLPDGPMTISVSSAGRHLKGLVDGRMITHGHAAPGPAGRCGILIDGAGDVRILSVEVTPLTEVH
jgi:uncharacterized membrane protein